MKIKAIDVFVQNKGLPKIESKSSNFKLAAIFNRGTQVFPGGEPRCQLTDVHQCRFECKTDVAPADTRALLEEIEAQGFEWAEIHKIYDF